MRAIDGPAVEAASLAIHMNKAGLGWAGTGGGPGTQLFSPALGAVGGEVPTSKFYHAERLSCHKWSEVAAALDRLMCMATHVSKLHS